MNHLLNQLRTQVKTNSPNLLSAAAVVGVLTTGYLAGRASIKVGRDLERHPIHDDTLQDRVRAYWKFYVPAAISGAVTVGSIIGANRLGSRRTIAAQALLAASERAYSEYRHQIVEELGERKDQSIRDKVAEKLVKENPPPEIMIAGTGDILCCELLTGRYFSSTMEKLRKAQNTINAQLLTHDYVRVDDFYYELGLTYTTYSGETGWKTPKLLELEFSSMLTPDGRPCLAFTYNYVDTL